MSRICELDSGDLPVRVGDYRLVELLGEGSMGSVFRAAREGPDGFAREYAIKVLRPEGETAEIRRKLFSREARVGGRLDHRNLVRTDDYFIEGDERFLVLELVEGDNLTGLLQTHGPLEPALAVDLVAQACEGLHHAHNVRDRSGAPLGLVHRDLKPDNIMVRNDGVVKVADFGIAKPTRGKMTAITEPEMTRGTVPYMSPEQLRAEELDPRSDVWAMGCVLFYALTGRHLFLGATGPSVMMRIIRMELDHEGRHAFDWMDEALPGSGAVLARCVALDPAERFADAAGLRQALLALKPGHRRTTLAEISRAHPPGWMTGAREPVGTESLAEVKSESEPAPKPTPVAAPPPPEPEPVPEPEPEESSLRWLLIAAAIGIWGLLAVLAVVFGVALLLLFA